MIDPLEYLAARVAPSAPTPGATLPVDPLALLQAKTGLTLDEIMAGTPAPEAVKRRYDAVPDSAELQRILALPVKDEINVEQLCDALTAQLKTPWGTQRLRPIQALALYAIWHCRGALLPIVAGGGKTLISYLAPTVLGARRPLLFVPAKLKRETRDKFVELAKHWRGPHPDAYRVESYEFLSNPRQGSILGAKGAVTQEGFLERYRPDSLFLDEAHKAKSANAVARKRFKRYSAENPGCAFVAASGTFAKLGLKDYAHIAAWCLPKGSPLPTRWKDLEDWAAALDDKVLEPLRPGALLKLCTPEEREFTLENPEQEQDIARQGFRRRLTSTPGVVASLDERLDIPLTVAALDPGMGDPVIEEHFQTLRLLNLTPSGEPVPDGISEWRHARELSLGLHYRWEPPAPEEWLLARKAWCTWCRQVLKHNRSGLDSEKQVKDAVDVGKYNDGGLLAKWREIEPTFTPNPVPEWHSTEALDVAAAWLARPAPDGRPRAGVCWVEHTWFAQRLSEVTGLPYFGRQGKDADGRFILEWVEAGGAHGRGKPCIASIASNAEGRNMQAWRDNLIMTMPQSPITAEQLIARTHRPGQEHAVHVDIWVGCYELLAGYYLACQGARANATREGGAQRILYADSKMPRLEEITARAGHRWQK